MNTEHSIKYPAYAAIFRADVSGRRTGEPSRGGATQTGRRTTRALPVFLALWIGLAGYAPRAVAQNTPSPAMDLSEPDGDAAKNDGDAASATITVPYDWGLRPSGLVIGDQFRLLFMSRAAVIAVDRNISTYDNAITLSASSGSAHSNIRAYGQSFKAFVNASDGTSGRTHTGMWSNNAWTDGSTSASSSGIPIYWLNGSKVADNYFDFCDKSWDNRWSSGQNHIKNERGATENGARVWTGMNGNCTAGANPVGPSFSNILIVPPVAYGPGAESAGDEGPLFKGNISYNNSYHLYGMSPVFELTIKVNIAFSLTGATFPEGATISVNARLLPRALQNDETVTLPLTYGGAASLGTDYTTRCASTPGVSCRNLNSRNAEVTFNGAQLPGDLITILEMDFVKDNVKESQETITLTFNDNTLTVGIVDPPPAVTLEFIKNTFSAPENAVNANPVLTLTPAAGEDIAVPLIFTDGTATSGTDYTPQASYVIASGKTRSAISIPIINDAIYEGDETFTMTIDTAKLPASVKAGSIASATMTIQDDDAPTPGVTVSQTVLNLAEGGAAGSYDISLQTQPSAKVTVTATSGDGGKVKVNGPGGSPANSATLSFSTSNYNNPQTITVTPQQDADANNESVTISHAVSNTGGYGGVTASSVDVNVSDDEAKGVTVSQTVLNLAEGGAAGSYDISLQTQPSGNVTVTATSGDGGKVKVNGPQGSPANSATLAFTTSNYNNPQTITVTPQQDADANDESVTISHAVSNTGGYGGVTASSVTVNVSDDETPTTPTLSVALSPASAQEGNAGASYATVTVSINPARSQATNFNTCLASAGTAIRGANADYQFVRFNNDTPLSLTNGCYAHTINANATQGRVRLRIRGDTEVEPDETIVVELRNAPQGVDIAAARGSATYTILNDDSGGGGGDGGGGDGGGPTDPTLPVVTIAGGADVTEGDNANFTLTAAPAPSESIAVSVRVEDRVSNFISSTTRGVHTVDIPTSGTATLAVRTVNDQSDEPDGAVVATVEGGSGYTPGDPATARITVNDDDTPTSAERLDNEIPEAFALEQNYPNPFNPATTIAFALDKAQHVTLSVHDMLGQQVRLLLEGPRPAGRYRVRFDAEGLASGPYVYILRTEEDVAVKTMALVK